MLPIDWNTAIQYANLVKIAESVAPSGSYGQSQIDQIKAGGYTFLQTLYGDELATDIDPHIGEVVSFGFWPFLTPKNWWPPFGARIRFWNGCMTGRF
jgi:hypothetical protein